MIAAAVGSLLLIILTPVVIQHTTASPAPPRSYTVPELAARLREDPQAWTGRTVLVRGQLDTVSVSCGPGVATSTCQSGQWEEIQAGNSTGTPHPPLALSRIVLPRGFRWVVLS